MTADRAPGRTPESARYFDDLKPGERFITGEWALDEAEIVSFARQFDPQPIHVDAAQAADGPYGGLIASGFQTMALGFRLFYELGVINEACIGGPGNRRSAFPPAGAARRFASMRSLPSPRPASRAPSRIAAMCVWLTTSATSGTSRC